MAPIRLHDFPALRTCSPLIVPVASSNHISKGMIFFLKANLLALRLDSDTRSLRRASTDAVRSWASQLAAESRDPRTVMDFYVWPKSLDQIYDQLRTTEGSMIALVGLQGAGKTSALLALESIFKIAYERSDVIHLKWKRERELFESLMAGSHEVSFEFLNEYQESLISALAYPVDFSRRSAVAKAIEREVGRSVCERKRKEIWHNIMGRKKLILIDTPDYSRTDKRALTKDLEGIHRLWINLSKTKDHNPNIVVAVQKEMFGGHFFFGKMRKIELSPLQPKEMLEAYVNRFKTTEPFTEEALLTAARMSRGIFRRFLGYINLTLESWLTYPGPNLLVDQSVVKEAVTLERLVEDMELELAEVFPRQSDAPRQAVQLLMLLMESGPQKQSRLAEQLGMEDYTISRLLERLESHRYVKRERLGTDKIVTSLMI